MDSDLGIMTVKAFINIFKIFSHKCIFQNRKFNTHKE